jgi:hypothetical protein
MTVAYIPIEAFDEHPVADRREVDPPLHRIAVGGQGRRHSARSSPRSRAKWLRVPAGTQTKGRS